MPAQTSIHTSFHQPTNTKTTDEQEEDNQNPRPERRSRKPRERKESISTGSAKDLDRSVITRKQGGKAQRRRQSLTKAGSNGEGKRRTQTFFRGRTASEGRSGTERHFWVVGGAEMGGKQANSKTASLPHPQQASSEKEERRDSSCRAGQGRAEQKGRKHFLAGREKKNLANPRPKNAATWSERFSRGGRRGGREGEREMPKRKENGNGKESGKNQSALSTL
jgi:hypothetical protein